VKTFAWMLITLYGAVFWVMVLGEIGRLLK
jgi:hypothetical protein